MRLRRSAALSLVFLVACASDPEPPGPQDQPESSDEVSEKKNGPGSDEENAKLDCSKLSSTGLEIGDVAPDLVLKDGGGKNVHLHDYCNETVILIASEF